jgi:hypothetical protein
METMKLQKKRAGSAMLDPKIVCPRSARLSQSSIRG